MKFDFSDACLLQAIKFSESEGKGAALKEIIFTADYINDSIFSYSEIS